MSEYNTLIVLLVKPSLSKIIYKKTLDCLTNLILSTKKTNISLIIDSNLEKSDDTDITPWSKVTRIRQRIIDEYNWTKFTHIFWIDADVVDFPATILDDLLSTNPNGITAPLVLIETTNIFYDTCAFILKNKSNIEPLNKNIIKGRNIDTTPPYVESGMGDIIEMDSVGSFLLVNVDVYKSGATYENHPAFTDHFSICRLASNIGRKVILNKNLIVYHAYLTNYGEPWH